MSKITISYSGMNYKLMHLSSNCKFCAKFGMVIRTDVKEIGFKLIKK